MATSYSELIAKVRDWSNRDDIALKTSVIQDSMRWAADTAYRDLKIPSLEYTQRYVLLANEDRRDLGLLSQNGIQAVIDEDQQNLSGLRTVRLTIPSDASTFIHIRNEGGATDEQDYSPTDEDGNDRIVPTAALWAVDSNGNLDVSSGSFRHGIVFNEKTDVRTFHDIYANKVSEAFWSRQRDTLLIAGFLQPGDVIELLYYRRLPALDARYLPVFGDFDVDTQTFDPFVDQSTRIDTGSAETEVTEAQVTALGINNPSLSPNDFIFVHDAYYAGAHVDNWLRDENERILVFGALSECFDYLQEDDQAQKYEAKFRGEIEELNQEEKMRRASGGNTQMHYSSFLI